MMRAVPIPPPFRGQFDRLPLAVVESPYAEVVENWNMVDGVARVRNGDAVFYSPQNVPTISPATVFSLTAFGDQKLFATRLNSGVGQPFQIVEWWDITNPSAPVSVYLVPTSGGSETLVTTLTFNKTIIYMGLSQLKPSAYGVQQYNATSGWGPNSYTWPANFDPYGGCVYRSRAYFIDTRTTTRYCYSNVEAIAGALTAVDLASVISRPGDLLGIRPLSQVEGRQSELLLAFIFSSGEVLIYSGTHPNAPDWTIVDRFFISRPIGYNAFCEIGGDVLVATQTEIVSLRALFSMGWREASDRAITANIRNRWAQIMESIRIADSPFSSPVYLVRVRLTYDEQRDRLIVALPVDIRRDGTLNDKAARFLIYDYSTQSWVEHCARVFDATFPVVANGFVNTATMWRGSYLYGGVGGVYQKEGRTDYVDDVGNTTTPETRPIAYDMTTAPIPTNKFGVNKLQGIDAILAADDLSTVQVQVIADLGAKVSAQQSLTGPDGVVTRTTANVGIEGSFVQVRFAGEMPAAANDVGLEVYAMNILSEQGRGRIR